MDYIYNEETKTYQIKEFQQVVADCENFIKNVALLDAVILTEDDLRAVKKSRTALNSKLKEIKDTRLQINKIILGEFNAQSKEVETMLDNASEALTQKINDFLPKEPPITTIVIKTGEEEKAKRIEALCLELGVEFKIKGEDK